MEYLKKILNVDVTYAKWGEEGSLPYFLSERYKFEVASINGLKTLFVYPLGEVEAISSVKKHLSLIGSKIDFPVVLVLTWCTSRQRKTLIENHMPFIVEDSQIYLPFMGVLLHERFKTQQQVTKQFSPSAQQVLFLYIYLKKRELRMKEAAIPLSLSPMSISRAFKELEAFGLFKTRKDGVEKVLFSDLEGKGLYEKAFPFLRSPVRKKGFCEKGTFEGGCKAGLTALFEYGMLNPPKVSVYALQTLPKNVALENVLVDEDKQVGVELWSYDPLTLSQNGKIDLLSLHQTLKGESQERVEGEIRKALDAFWKDYDG